LKQNYTAKYGKFPYCKVIKKRMKNVRRLKERKINWEKD
jgi:hypothetical protein